MKALVTGATGFVGSHLIDTLLEAGDRVTALVRTPRKAEGLAERGVILISGDLHDDAALERAVAGQDVIYHSAGLVAARDDATFLAINREGTARIRKAAEQSGSPRFVFVSSLAAGGPASRGARRRDDEPPEPITGYGRSKLAGEAVVRQSRLPWIIVRPPAVYGPRDPEFFRLFKAARLGILPVFGDGGQELSLVYVKDLARALAALARSEPALGGTWYPCHREVLTSRDVALTIGRAMGRTVRILPLPVWIGGAALSLTGLAARLAGGTTLLTPDKGKELFAPAWTCDPAPLERVTGGAWSAQYDLAEGTQMTAGWYREAGWL